MQITELVEKAVQCLEALGLDPETIYDYRCSAFKPVAERMQLMTDVKTGNFMVHEQYFTIPERKNQPPNLQLAHTRNSDSLRGFGNRNICLESL